MRSTRGAHFWGLSGALLCFAQGIPTSSGLAQSGSSLQWPTPAPREEVPAAFSSAPLVLLSEEIHFSNRVDRSGRSQSMKATAEVHATIRVMDMEGVWTASTKGIRIDGILLDVKHHARVIHPDGTVTELADDAVSTMGNDASAENDPRRLVFNRSDLAVGDDIEYVVRSGVDGPLRFEALYLQGEYPVLRKEIVLDVEASMTPLIQAYNGFPPYEADPVGAEDRRKTHVRIAPETDRYRWRSGPLTPASTDPLLLKRNCLPFLRVRGATMDLAKQANRAQLMFNRDFPHVTVHGRKHENDFTRFVERVRAKYPFGSAAGPIAEVIRFVHDSVSIVPPRPGPARSIGEFFHDRRIPYVRLVSLYRSLFIIMDIPFNVGYARSIYLEPLAPDSADIIRATQLLLGFRDEATGGLHVICPGTTRGAWLLDEVPMEIAGTTATFFKFRRGLLPPKEIFMHTLPQPRLADNGRIERLALRVDPDGTVRRTQVGGTLKGYPAAIAEHAAITVSGGPPSELLEVRMAPWFAVPGGTRTTIVPSPDTGSRRLTWSAHTDSTVGMPLGNAASFRLADVFTLPMRDGLSISDSCLAFIPFPFAVRSDIVIDVGALQGSVLWPIQDINMENEAGAFRCTTETLEDGRYLVHLEFVSTATLIDGVMAKHINELRKSAMDVLDAPLFAEP